MWPGVEQATKSGTLSNDGLKAFTIDPATERRSDPDRTILDGAGADPRDRVSTPPYLPASKIPSITGAQRVSVRPRQREGENYAYTIELVRQYGGY